MNLLDKFASVKIEADNRISARDAEYCRQQQTVYEKAGETLCAMLALVEPLEQDKADLNGMSYLPGRVDRSTLSECLCARHCLFIARIVNYFANAHQVELDAAIIQNALIPQKPKQPDYWSYDLHSEEWKQALREHEAAVKAYTENLQSLSLRYEDIVEEIFSQLGGFSFEEKALSELFARCYEETHSRWGSREELELKGATLKLTGYLCKHSAYGSSWEIMDGMVAILKALAWYEGGRLDDAVNWFPGLLSHKWDVSASTFEYSDYPHVRKIRLFKNRAVEIKFCDAAAALNFVETCLRSGKSEDAV